MDRLLEEQSRAAATSAALAERQERRVRKLRAALEGLRALVREGLPGLAGRLEDAGGGTGDEGAGLRPIVAVPVRGGGGVVSQSARFILERS